METNSEADEPAPPATPDAAPHAAPESTMPISEHEVGEQPEPDAISSETAASPDELTQLAEASARARLSQADEERLTTLLKEAILGGRASVARAVELLPTVPWIVAVRAVEQTWPELTAGFRTQLLSGLAKDESDAARRMRLSVARALFKIEVPVAMKLALGALKDLRDKETGGLSPKNAQIVANVFIGRGKPWLSQLPLEELKPAELDLLVQCAIAAAFSIPHPPVTQLGVLNWAQQAAKLESLPEPALATATAIVGRWSAKWQNALRREVPGLPQAFLDVLRPETAAGSAENSRPEDEAAAEGAEDSEGDSAPEGEGEAEAPRKERPVYEPRPQRQPEPTEVRDREPQRERPVYTPRNAGTISSEPRTEPRSEGRGRTFNLNEALKGIEAHVQTLRTELAQAQAKARVKEERPRRVEKALGPIVVGEPTPDELARLNLQLESRNVELQSRIEELTQHSEDLAASVGAMTSEPVNDTASQLRSLLGFKLHEDYEDFLALEQEGNDIVVQQHYRTIIRHVFEVLREVQIPLEGHSPADQ